MQEMFSTTAVRARDRFCQLRDFCDGSLIKLDRKLLCEDRFNAVVTGAKVGGLTLLHMRLNDLWVASTPRNSRKFSNTKDVLFATFVQEGSLHLNRQDTSSPLNVGDFTLYDPSTPWAIQYRGDLRVLSVELPRAQVEGMLGPARHLAGLVAYGTLPTATLARSFIFHLAELAHQLSPDAAERMALVATDLLVASLAERMGMDDPKPLHGTLIVQRAKTYVEANLGWVDLDPAAVAAAVGVSLRHLQALFHEHGQPMAQWIWRRRLETAARRLSDPGLLHLQVSEVAYGCGFTSQSHFCRRFRDSYGMSPRDYRHEAIRASTGHASTGHANTGTTSTGHTNTGHINTGT